MSNLERSHCIQYEEKKSPGKNTKAFHYLSFASPLIGGSLAGIEVRTLRIGLPGAAVK